MFQELASLFSSAVGMDIGILNENANIVAGTGKYYHNIGGSCSHDSYVNHIIQTGEPILVEAPTQEHQCFYCVGRKQCPYTIGVLSPILAENKVRGIVCLVGYELDDKKKILQQRSHWLNILNNFSNCLANHITQQHSCYENQYLVKNVDSLIELINDPLVILNSSQEITHINSVAKSMFNISLNSDGFFNVLPEFLLSHLSNINQYTKNIAYWVSPNNTKFRILIKPVRAEHVTIGYTILFQQENIFDSFNSKSFLTPSSKNNSNSDPFKHIIGNSIIIKNLKEQACKIASTDSTVLIRGESGTGKELFAQGIHNASLRQSGPLVIVNCSALPENLLESEMFGYEDGAFTGAKRGGKQGKFEMADKGTLFLDEVGDLPLPLQSKLLRVLEDSRVERIGSCTHPKKVNVRIITATNRNLEDMIAQGTFRQDLYFRLNVIPLHIPPLRQRREDIPLIIEHFLRLYANRYGHPIKQFTPEAICALQEYHWPGNIRELRNIIEYIITITDEKVIKRENLPEQFKNYSYNKTFLPASNKNIGDTSGSLFLLDIEKELIKEAIAKFGNSTEGKKRASKSLGISLTTLYRRIQKYSLN